MTTQPLAIDFQHGWSQAWDSVATFVPKLAMFLVILVVGWIIASIVERIVARLLDRVGFNRVLERSGLRNSFAGTSYHPAGLLAKLAKYAIVLITLQGAFNVFGPNAVSNLLGGIVSWLPKAFVAIVLVVVAGAVAKMARDMIAGTLGGLSYGRMLGTVAWAFIWGVGILAALHQVGIATVITAPILWTALATIGGIAIVGLGGGMIRPMQQRWEGWLNTLERDLPSVGSRSATTGEARTWYNQPGQEAGTPQSGMQGGGAYQ